MPEKYVICPKCQTKVLAAYGLGRKPLNIPVNKVYGALHDSSTVTEAAEKLVCSRGYIYKVLKEHGMSPKALTKGVHSVKDFVKKPNRFL